ncbi:hypothetical protein GCM10022409_20350 [Hymenobacter glaciei]|uniref:Uncharacterized protein n=1 Tax=Hymenobacter glaciei TaxID=877209 RepID=A0ABP7U3W5_9BACT
MLVPLFPLISIGNDGVIDIIPSAEGLSKASTRVLLNTAYPNTVELFDRNNGKWKYRQVSAELKNNWLTKILAITVHNPILCAEVIWTFNSNYRLPELKEKIRECVDKDDDIITQFEGADIIKAAIGKAINFNEVMDVLNKYLFEVEPEQLWQEQEMRGK